MYPYLGNRIYVYLYADRFEGELTECSEGDLQWIKKTEVMNLKLWEGDKDILKETDRRRWIFYRKNGI